MIRKLLNGDIDRVADIWLKTNLKAHYFISNQYWTSNYELVKEMMSQKGQWKLCVQMSSHYLGNNRKQQWNIDDAFRIYSTTHG